MNDEIKEILDNPKIIMLSYGNFILLDDYVKLKDYITNLQEQLHQASLDIQELTERDIECPSWCDKLTNLQQERDKYKMRCYKAKKMIWDNYGVLDKYQIDLMEDILDGKEDE